MSLALAIGVEKIHVNSIFALFLAGFLLVSGSVAAGDLPGVGNGADAPALLDFFDASRAPKPLPGQWIEYRLGFPVDPLESSLRPDPELASSVGDPKETVDVGDGHEMYKPSFDPGVAWRVLPLRIEVRQVTPEGCTVLFTFDGDGHQLFLPVENGEERKELRYDAPKAGVDRSFFIKMGSGEYEVEMIRRTGNGYGFVRYFCPDVPFGVFRFATRDVDLVLVGFGQGRPPEFPIPVDPPIQPPVGQLYHSTN